MTETNEQEKEFLDLILMYRQMKYRLDLYTSRADRPCVYLCIWSDGNKCIKSGTSEISQDGKKQFVKSCNYQEFDTSKRNSYLSSICTKPYHQDDSPIRGKTIENIAEIRNIVDELGKQVLIAVEKSIELSRLKFSNKQISGH